MRLKTVDDPRIGVTFAYAGEPEDGPSGCLDIVLHLVVGLLLFLAMSGYFR